jgi:hypothetical protein
VGPAARVGSGEVRDALAFEKPAPRRVQRHTFARVMLCP